MKKKTIAILVMIMALNLFCFTGRALCTDEIELLWGTFEKHQKDKLLKESLKILDEIYEKCLKKDKHCDALKAIFKKAAIAQYLDGGSANIRTVEKALESASPELKPLMLAAMAEWCRYKLGEDSRRGGIKGSRRHGGRQPDETGSWDREALLTKVFSLYEEAVASCEKVADMKISKFYGVIEKGEVPERYRPFIFDFVANKALNFFAAACHSDENSVEGEPGGLKFDAALFSQASDFIRFDGEKYCGGDSGSVALRIIRLHQKIAKRHMKPGNETALVASEVGRFGFFASRIAGAEAERLYVAALEKLIEKYGKNEACAPAYIALAWHLAEKRDQAKAYALLVKAEKLFGETIFGGDIAAAKSFLRPSFYEIMARKVMPFSGTKRLSVRCQNIGRLYFRAVLEDYRSFYESNGVRTSPGMVSREAINSAISRKPAAEWSVRPDSGDGAAPGTLEVEMPELAPGYYRILAGYKKDFSTAENEIGHCLLWVSDIEAVAGAFEKNRLSGFVRRYGTGDPIEKATVSVSFEKGAAGRVTRNTMTDGNGRFEVDCEGMDPYSSGALMSIEHEKYGTVIDNSCGKLRFHNNYRSKYDNAVLLTDRAVYRPGQEICCKAICVSADQASSSYRVSSGKKLDIAFLGPDEKLIEKSSAVTNEFGSCVIRFRIPDSVLTGKMNIRITRGDRDPDSFLANREVLVEDYKTPTLCMEIGAVEGTYIYGEEITVPGKLVAFSGGTVPDASVKYRVLAMPYYWEYANSEEDGGFDSSISEQASGAVRCGANGEFTIRFKATPYFWSHPRFGRLEADITCYKLMIEATDTAGVTVCDRKSVMAGREPLYAVMSADPIQYAGKGQTVAIDVENLNGVKFECAGTVEVLALRGPEKVTKKEIVEKNRFIVADGDDDDFAIDTCIYEDIFEKGGKVPGAAGWETWPAAVTAGVVAFSTGPGGTAEIRLDLPAGAYRLALNATGKGGRAVRTYLPMIVIDRGAKRFGPKIPYYFAVSGKKLFAGETLEILCATGLEKDFTMEALITSNDKVVGRFDAGPGVSQKVFEVPVTEALEGGFGVETVLSGPGFFRRGSANIETPYFRSRLDVRVETKRKALEPGAREELVFRVFDPDGAAGSGEVELAATLYDEALDSIAPNTWRSLESYFYQDRGRAACFDLAYPVRFIASGYHVPEKSEGVDYMEYGDFIGEIRTGRYGSTIGRLRGGSNIFENMPENIENENHRRHGNSLKYAVVRESLVKRRFREKLESLTRYRHMFRTLGIGDKSPLAQEGVSNSDLLKIRARRDLSDLAFFAPKLRAKTGEALGFEFTMPEKLTRWKLIGLAHGKDMKSGLAGASFVTRKDIMVQPNPPGFLRAGDIAEIPVKIENISDTPLSGRALMAVFDASRAASLDALFDNGSPGKEFTVGARSSVYLNWRIRVAHNVSAVTIRAAAAAGEFSDAVEMPLGILPDSARMVESVPIFGGGGERKSFELAPVRRLFETGRGTAGAALTVQASSSPAWYALLALPALASEGPDETTSGALGRLYAFALMRSLLERYPGIAATASRLAGNSTARARLARGSEPSGTKLSETPWSLCDSLDDGRMASLAKLFDSAVLDGKISEYEGKLKSLQGKNGLFPWLPGREGKLTATLFVCAGYARLRNAGFKIADGHFIYSSIDALDKFFESVYKTPALPAAEQPELGNIAAYLYVRSFFLEYRPYIFSSARFKNYMDQAAAGWHATESRTLMSFLAVALKRLGTADTFKKTVAMLKDNSTVDDRGMRLAWSDSIGQWFHNDIPIGPHVAMLEALDEAGETRCVELCKRWILSEKRTRSWRNSAVTAEAIYSLLTRGEDLLGLSASVEISLGSTQVAADTVEAGTGYFEKTFHGASIKPDFASVAVKKADSGYFWGGIHLEAPAKLSDVEGSGTGEITVEKSFFIERRGARTPVLEAMPEKLRVGDRVAVRLVVRCARALDFVHVRDLRPAGFEPADRVSGPKNSGNTFYYQSNRNEATHFFFDGLSSGESVVIEYDMIASHRGEFCSGPATVESFYAPEYNSHSSGGRFVIE